MGQPVDDMSVDLLMLTLLLFNCLMLLFRECTTFSNHVSEQNLIAKTNITKHAYCLHFLIEEVGFIWKRLAQ